MSRQLTPSSTLENLKKEAKRWLKALRAGDTAARARLERSHPAAPPQATLRDVQHALAREHGFDGWTALKHATATRDIVDPRQRALQQLLEACGTGEVTRAAELLDEYPDIIDERATLPGNTGERTALHFGVGHADIVRLLLARGANPNIRDEGDDAMPLHFAAERGDMEVVRLLIEHGADPVGDGTDHELNVVGWAVCWDYVHNAEVAEYLLAHGAQHTMHTAVALGDVDAIRRLAARVPADIEKALDRTNLRRRPLHLAVVKKQPAALAALLELGADTDATDAAGLTPLDQAALDGEQQLVQQLLDHGAVVSLPAAIALERSADIERWLRADPACLKPGGRWATVIVQASARGSAEVVERLIRAGASVHVRDDSATAVDQTVGFTALHAAAFKGNTDVVRVLLKHGANPNVRESKYCAPPAGWADYAGHDATRDLILQAEIDLFQAIDFDLIDRIPEIVRQSPWLLHKRFAEYSTCESRPEQWYPEPWHTPLAWAAHKNNRDAVRVLLEQGAAQIAAPDGRTLLQLALDAGHAVIAQLLQQHRHVEQTHEGRVRWFVKHACPDHDIRGPWHHAMARHTAQRLLEQHPEIARDSFYTAVICGDIAAVERALAERPELANERGGPKEWEPLLYLCFTRLPDVAAANDNAVDSARLLLDHGADPNVYFMAGDSHYTPLVGAIGEGEEDRPAHTRRDELVRLLLERGANPYDGQVVYNSHFHGRALWFLELIYQHTVAQGRKADWDDPEWHMLDAGGYGTGARYFLEMAIRQNDLQLAEWVLSHGAHPNAAPPTDPRWEKISLHEAALRMGRTELADMLVRYGATPSGLERPPEERFIAAALRLDVVALRRLFEQHPQLLHSSRAMAVAAEQDRADVVALLLDVGVPIEIENEHKQRPLHAAAASDAVRVAQLLIERGAEIDPFETAYGNTPLATAVHYQYPRMIELLSRYSRDIWQLVFAGAVDRVRELLREQPELARTVSDAQETPLMWLPNDDAAAVALVRLFVAHGAHAGIRDSNGMTAADYASRRGLTEAAELLRTHTDATRDERA